MTQNQIQTIEKVRDGMTVVDVNGEKLGKVKYVQIGEPDAATVQGNEPAGRDVQFPSTAMVGDVGDTYATSEPEVPEPKRSQLLRSGFIRVDPSGFGKSDRYVESNGIKAVSDDTVTLTVTKEQFMGEG